MTELQDLLTITDVAKALKVTPQYARKLIKEEKLIATRVGSQWVVKPEDLENYKMKYDVLVEPDDHERLSSELPEIVALSFFSGAMYSYVARMRI